MAFDWIAGTALVVGIGSLALTWQSTRAAKRAIDTSIEIYEKQKQDNFDNERKRLELLKNHIRNKLFSIKNSIDNLEIRLDVFMEYKEKGNVLERVFTDDKSVLFVCKFNNQSELTLTFNYFDFAISDFKLDLIKLDSSGELANFIETIEVWKNKVNDNIKLFSEIGCFDNKDRIELSFGNLSFSLANLKTNVDDFYKSLI